jgi:8-oxo-dGTP diphosphatase
VLENHQGDVLLTQRKKHQHLAGYWEFPGGKMERGESAIEALQRECIEELAYHTTANKPILHIHHSYPSINVQLHVFHDINANPSVKPAENQNMQWVKKSKLADIKLPDANHPIIKYLNRT